MRQIVCDRCTTVISDPDDIFTIETISQGTHIKSTYELCDSCKVEFYKYLRKE